MATPDCRPLKILQLKPGSSEVEINRENLNLVTAGLRESGASCVSILAVMGAYRTGKSFLLDLLMRYLRTRMAKMKAEEEREAAAAMAAAAAGVGEESSWAPVDGEEPPPRASAPEEPPPPQDSWRLGEEGGPKLEPPAWLLEGDQQRISEGSRTDDKSGGFAWRPGKDKCTEGIWLWSAPFVFTDKAGRRIGVLLMDTQGAWDDTLTKAQSATIFGLTALLSSKLIYNIQNRIEEDKLEGLDYITTFAQTVCNELPGEEAPFGRLEILVRDWANYDDGFSVAQCLEQMNEHQEDHMSPWKVPEDAKPRAERLQTSFKGIKSFGLPHPGLKVSRPQYAGEISCIDRDFMKLLDVWVEKLFGEDFPQPSAPLGMEITVGSFQQVVMNFAEAFQENADQMAIGLREAFVKVEMMTCKEDLIKRFREQMGRVAPETAVVEPHKLKQETDKLVESIQNEFEMKLKPWRLKASEEENAVSEFARTVREAANMRVMQNEQQVEGATMKLVASPVVGCGAYFLLVHQWVLYIVAGVGAYCHAKKWSTRTDKDMCDPAVFQGVGEDVKKWGVQRYKDVQAMQVALQRFNPNEAMETLTKASKQAGTMAATAAASAGLNLGSVGGASGSDASGTGFGIGGSAAASSSKAG